MEWKLRGVLFETNINYDILSILYIIHKFPIDFQKMYK